MMDTLHKLEDGEKYAGRPVSDDDVDRVHTTPEEDSMPKY